MSEGLSPETAALLADAEAAVEARSEDLDAATDDYRAALQRLDRLRATLDIGDVMGGSDER